MPEPLYRFENYHAITPLPRDIDHDGDAPLIDPVYGYGQRHPKKPNIIIRFKDALWTVCAGDRMLFNTYDRERVERFVERVC